MKKTIQLTLVVLATLVMTGCLEKEVPKCSNAEVKQTVASLYGQMKENMNGNIFGMAFGKTLPEKLERLSMIRASSYDKEVQKRTCNAKATFSGGVTADITYNVQMTEESGEVYVELEGDFMQIMLQQGIFNSIMENNKTD